MNSYISRLSWLAALLPLASPNLGAQTETNQSTAANPPETPVIMSAFNVITTQDTGYVDTNSATAFKTSQSLLTIPQPVLVVTRDMITDTGFSNDSSDVMQFAGVADYYRGESYEIRGVRISYDLLDEMQGIMPRQDNIFIDSYEVIRGPAAVFYPNATLGGIILKTTRKPLTVAQGSIDVSYDQFGTYRFELDSTGPLTKVGNGVLAYRVETAFQDGPTYFNNLPNEVSAGHPSFQYSDARNKVLVAVDYQRFHFVDNAAGLISPDGGFYSGAGRANEMNVPPGTGITYRYFDVRLQFQNKISTNWEMKTYAMVATERFQGLDVYSTAVNWAAQTDSWGVAAEDSRYRSYDILSDFTGKYPLFFGMNARSTFGYTFQKEVLVQTNLIAPSGVTTAWNNFPLSVPVSSYVNYPLYNTWTLSPTDPYGGGFYGNSSGLYAIDTYFQEEIEAVPDRLTLVAAGTWRYLETDTILQPPNFGAISVPFSSTDQIVSNGLYRLGAVLQIIPRQVAIYTVTSNTTKSNGTEVDINGNTLPFQKGQGTEVGLKTDLFNDRLTSTTAIYRIAMSDVGSAVGISPTTGTFYYQTLGGTVQKGWDTDVSFKVTDNLQGIFTFYHGSVLSQPSQLPVATSYTGMWSIFGKYEFDRSSSLNGLTIGGGASEIRGRVESNGGDTYTPAQLAANPTGLVNIKPEVMFDMFVRYRLSKHWLISVSLDNILDKNYAVGAENVDFGDASTPRDVSGKIIFKF